MQALDHMSSKVIMCRREIFFYTMQTLTW